MTHPRQVGDSSIVVQKKGHQDNEVWKCAMVVWATFALLVFAAIMSNYVQGN